MTTTVHDFVKGQLPVVTVTQDDPLAGRIRTRVSITDGLPSETKSDLSRKLALKYRRHGRLTALAERVRRERPLLSL